MFYNINQLSPYLLLISSKRNTARAPAIQAKEEEIGISISGITLFGLISMFLYTYLFRNTVVYDLLLGNPIVYAIWVGSGVHESAQVIAAACTLSLDCMQPALIIKSIRIFMIAPVVLAYTRPRVK